MWGYLVVQVVEALCTDWKVVGLIHDEVIWIFQSFWPHCGTGVNPASNTNQYQYVLGVKANNLAAFMCRMPRSSGSLNLLEASVPVRAFIGIALAKTGRNIFNVHTKLFWTQTYWSLLKILHMEPCHFWGLITGVLKTITECICVLWWWLVSDWEVSLIFWQVHSSIDSEI